MEVAARAVGIGVVRERVWAWLISAFIMGVAGGLYAHHIGMLNPDAFWFSEAILITVMLIVGGMRSLAGAFIGALGISVISELLYRVEQGIAVGPIHLPARPGLKELVYSAILIVVLIWRRQGIMGSREFELPPPRALPTEQAAPEEKGPVSEVRAD